MERMTAKRSQLEIHIDVLKAISKGTRKPTRIMYRTNLSWKPLTKVVESLANQGLIDQEKQGTHTIYRITKKGRNVLDYFNEAMRLIEIQT
jgi:predicted transcriptional regulator